MNTTNRDIYRELGALEARVQHLEETLEQNGEVLHEIHKFMMKIQGGYRLTMMFVAFIAAVGGMAGSLLTLVKKGAF